MSSETEIKNNAHRLAYALYCICEDGFRINAMAKTLNYEPNQLQTDLKDLYSYIREIEQNIREKKDCE